MHGLFSVTTGGRKRTNLAGSDLLPVLPVKPALLPVRPGADFFSQDNGLRGFLRFAPGAPGVLRRYPEETPKTDRERGKLTCIGVHGEGG